FHVRDVVGRADNPIVLVAADDVQNLLVVWQHDHGGVAGTCLKGNEAAVGGAHFASGRSLRAGGCCQDGREHDTEDGEEPQVTGAHHNLHGVHAEGAK